jgi:hypothetical protein
LKIQADQHVFVARLRDIPFFLVLCFDKERIDALMYDTGRIPPRFDDVATVLEIFDEELQELNNDCIYQYRVG